MYFIFSILGAAIFAGLMVLLLREVFGTQGHDHPPQHHTVQDHAVQDHTAQDHVVQGEAAAGDRELEEKTLGKVEREAID